MPFGNITAQTITYEPRQPGTYTRSSVTFGSPGNEFRLRGATLRKDGVVSASVTRVMEKDVVLNGDTVRKNCSVSLNIQLPKEGYFTPTEIDSLAADISEFLTATTISRMLQGES